MPEFPLSLRLIGLRVTKLKDLKEDEKRGIKRVRLYYLPIRGIGYYQLSSKTVLRASWSNPIQSEQTAEDERRDAE